MKKGKEAWTIPRTICNNSAHKTAKFWFRAHVMLYLECSFHIIINDQECSVSNIQSELSI